MAMSNVNAQQAAELVNQADNTIKKWIYLSGNKWEDALEMYSKAANKYKMAKMFKEASDVFLKIVPCHLKLNNKYEAASCYVDAANCVRKVSKDDAAVCMTQAISLYTELGKFAIAAKLEKELGELFEEDKKYEQAIQHLKQAADYFEGEQQKSTANTCTQKIAHLYASIEKYDDAINAFEQSSKIALEDKLLKWGSKEYLFKASICQLARMNEVEVEVESVKSAVEEYKDRDVHFPESYECKLIEGLLEALAEKNVKKFATALKEFNTIKKLDDWAIGLLLIVRKKIEAPEASQQNAEDWT